MAQDRFTTHWTGPFHPVAMQWAAKQGFSYTIPGGIVVEMGPGMFMDTSRPSHLSPSHFIASIAEENDIYDDLVRAHHAQDTDLDTGTGTEDFDQQPWNDRTRGQKLRYCVHWKGVYQRGLNRAQNRVTALESVINRNDHENNCLRMVKQDVVMLTALLDLTTQLEGLVQQETSVGWQWQTGLAEQRAVRESMHTATNNREAYFGKECTTPAEVMAVLGIVWVPGIMIDNPLGIGLS